MLTSFLDVPDDPDTQAEEGYSPFVARELADAYDALARQEFFKAWGHLKYCEGAAECPRQRIRVHYNLGLCHLADRNISLARDRAQMAMALAKELDDLAALGQVALLAADVESTLLAFDAASRYRDIVLEALRALEKDAEADGKPIDVTEKIDQLIEQSLEAFFLERYQDSTRLVDLARSLLTPAMKGRSRSTQELKQRALIEWLTALHDRWRGEPWSALGRALSASQLFGLLDEPWNASRIQNLVAEAALDLLQHDLDGALPTDRGPFLTLAGANIDRALALARVADDPSAKGLATLTRVRYLRIRGDSTDHVPTIEAVIRTAEGLGDPVLLTQAHTALGFEVAAQGDRQAALEHHRRALKVLEGTNVKAFGVFAQRELARAGEMDEEPTDPIEKKQRKKPKRTSS
jgi:tetratricopeptide (TPR) repeat protein